MYDTTWSAWIQPLAVVQYIGHIPPTSMAPYCYYKLVTNMIRAVKKNMFCHTIYTIYHGCQPIDIQGSNHPVYNCFYSGDVRSVTALELSNRRAAARVVKLKIQKQNNKDFYQPNQGVE
jgi:hypothetical protein